MHICVFCGAKFGTSKAYVSEAEHLGKILGIKKHVLVYGGGNIGLMGKLSKSIQKNQGKTIGVLPKIFETDQGNEDKVILVETFEHRKAVMESKSDAFIVLPGGIGTIDEATDVLMAKQHKFHDKPLVFVNTEGFFDDFLKHLTKILKYKFAKSNCRYLWYVAKNSDEAINFIEKTQLRKNI